MRQRAAAVAGPRGIWGKGVSVVAVARPNGSRCGGDGWARPRRNSNEPSENHPNPGNSDRRSLANDALFPCPEPFCILIWEGQIQLGHNSPFCAGTTIA